MRENCLICHAEEMVTGQRLTPSQWKAEVEKMVGWGAPLNAEEATPLAGYLAREYPSDSPPPQLHRMTYEQALDLVRPQEEAELRGEGDPTTARRYTPRIVRIVTGRTARGRNSVRTSS